MKEQYKGKLFEMKKLQKENEKIRDIIAELTPNDFQDEMFKAVNELIENEIEQEKLCGE